MKKIVSIILVLECIVCMTACGSAGNDAIVVEKAAESGSGTEAETLVEAGTEAETQVEAGTEVETEVKADNGARDEIDPAFFSIESIKKMFEEKGYLDYYVIYEEANNEAPKTDYNGEQVVMPADLTKTMVDKIGDTMTYQENGNTFTLWDKDSIVSLYGEPYEYQGVFLLANIYETFQFPEGCKNLDEYFVSCNGDNVEFKEVLSDDLLITAYKFKYGYMVDLFYLVPDSDAMVAFKYELPFDNSEEEIAKLKQFGLPIITDYYKD